MTNLLPLAMSRPERGQFQMVRWGGMMRSYLCFCTVLTLCVSTIGNCAFGQDQDMSFRDLDNMSSFDRDMLEMAIESGQLTRGARPSERTIDLEGMRYGSTEEIALFVRLLIIDVCPNCSTTTSGSTVRVKYGGDSSAGKKALAVDHSDNYDADEVKESCEDLLDRYEYDRDGKDILVIDNNDDEEKVALCYDRN